MRCRVDNEIEGSRLECSLFFQSISRVPYQVPLILKLIMVQANTWFVSKLIIMVINNNFYSKHCSFFLFIW